MNKNDTVKCESCELYKKSHKFYIDSMPKEIRFHGFTFTKNPENSYSYKYDDMVIQSTFLYDALYNEIKHDFLLKKLLQFEEQKYEKYISY